MRATVSNQDNTRHKVGRWLHLKVWRSVTSAAVIGGGIKEAMVPC